MIRFQPGCPLRLMCVQRLNHSAILHVFGCVRVAGQPLQMVMELCDSGSLFERIHRYK